MNLKNNLFNYATSELSQDAFLCWLASYTLEDAEPDDALRSCAREMLELFVPEFNGPRSRSAPLPELMDRKKRDIMERKGDKEDENKRQKQQKESSAAAL